MVTEYAPGMTRQAVERLSRQYDEPAWLADARLRAWQIFEMSPMPSRQDEEWRRTNPGGLRLDELVPFAEPSGQIESPLRLDGNVGGLITQMNSVTTDRSLQDHIAEDGVIFTDLQTAACEHPDLVQRYFMTEAVNPEIGKFAALNAAYWSGGTFLYVPRGVEVVLPLRSLYGLTEGGIATFGNTLLVLEDGARATYIEEYVSPEVDRQSLNAGVGEAYVGQGAHLTFITLQDWAGKVWDVSTQRALLGRDSRIDWLVINVGTGTTKTNIETGLQGQGAFAQMLGIIWGARNQHSDYHTVQDHIAPHTTSDLLYKSALTDEAKSVFSGRIRVVQGAMGTDAYQANRNVLLSEKAAAFPSPNLEIEANEVRCTHGATVGKIDQDQLFYLMSRGIPRDMATRIVVEGFFEDVLQREPVASIRDNLRDLIGRKLDES